MYMLFINSTDVILPGSLVMADQVRYMVYRVTREDCSRPDLGWDSFTQTTAGISRKINQRPALSSYALSIIEEMAHDPLTAVSLSAHSRWYQSFSIASSISSMSFPKPSL